MYRCNDGPAAQAEESVIGATLKGRGRFSPEMSLGIEEALDSRLLQQDALSTEVYQSFPADIPAPWRALDGLLL